MKLSFALYCLGASVIALGAPENVAGMKFRHSLPGLHYFNKTETDLLLNANGTYTGLQSRIFRELTVLGGPNRQTLVSKLVEISIPPNGNWTYRRLDHTTAELVIDDRTLLLRFDDGKNSGNVEGRTQGGDFSFDAYSTAIRIVNCSALCYVSPGRNVSLGFVISEGNTRVLVRAIGPGLRTFGISQALDNPVLKVFQAGFRFSFDPERPEVSRATLETAAERVGAFPLPSANDHAMLLTFGPGAFIAEVAAADVESAGEVLIEVYQLP